MRLHNKKKTAQIKNIPTKDYKRKDVGPILLP